MENSLKLSLSGNSSVLEVQYFPPIELSPNKNYVLGLIERLTFNSIPNIDTGNNKFYVGKEELFLPTGSYEIVDIANFLRETLALKGISFGLSQTIIHFAVSLSVVILLISVLKILLVSYLASNHEF